MCTQGAVFSCDFCFDELFVINLFEDDVNYSGTFVNKLTTSNEMATYSIGAFVVFDVVPKVFCV